MVRPVYQSIFTLRRTSPGYQIEKYHKLDRVVYSGTEGALILVLILVKSVKIIC